MSVAFSPDGSTLASRSDDKTIRLWDLSSGKGIRTLRHQDLVSSVAFSPDGTTLVSRSYDKTIKLWIVDNSPPDLAGYLDPRNPWYRLEGSGISLNSQTGDRLVDREPQFLNVSPVSHVGILHSTRSPEKKNRALFWNYLHAGNWNSAGVLYARLTDPASKESAREMTVLRRAAKAQSAFDGGLYRHARWHLEEITPLLKPDETDPAMLRAKELIERLKDDLDQREASDGRKDSPK